MQNNNLEEKEIQNNNLEEKEIQKTKSLKGIIIKYSICIIICLALTITSLILRKFTNVVAGTKEFYRIWADSFTIPGLVFIVLTLIIFLINEGSLTALGYMGRVIARAIFPHSNKERMNYYEYSQSRKKITGYLCVLWVGLAFFLVGLVFLILYYNA